jgi:hypothetical protein
VGKRRPKATLDDVISRIVGHVKGKGKIIGAPCEGVLVDELSPVLNRLCIDYKGHTRAEVILAAITKAVEDGTLERFDDGIDLIIALPNEWPPERLRAFTTISDDDFEPLYESCLLRHTRNKHFALRELTHH